MLHIKSVKPLFTNIVTTAERFSEDLVDGGIIVARKGDLKLWQEVVAVGSTVRDIHVGDKVMIDCSHYAVKKYSKDSLQNDMDNNPVIDYKFNWVTIDNEKGEPEDHLLLVDRDVLYVFEGEEKNDLITPSKKTFVVS